MKDSQPMLIVFLGVLIVFMSLIPVVGVMYLIFEKSRRDTKRQATKAVEKAIEIKAVMGRITMHEVKKT